MSEKVFNLFLFVENDIIVGLGARCHEAHGSDREKLSFLHRQVKHDPTAAIRFPVPRRYQLVFPDGTTGTGLQYQSYQTLAMLQRYLDLFEDIFTHFQASDSPLMCITPIVAGEPRIEAVSRL
jgi:hypothetical protein